MKRKSFLCLVVVLMVCWGCNAFLFADVAGDLVMATESLEGDYEVLSDWIGSELSKPLSFLPGIGPDLPANVLSLPHFELGISLATAIRKLDESSFDALPTDTVDSTQIDIPKTVLIPVPMLQAKLGLPSLPVLGDTDIGIKLGAFSYDINDCEIKHTLYGIQLRKEIWKDGIASLGGVAINLSFNKLTGSIEISRDYNHISQETYGPVNYEQKVESVSSWETEWDINSIGIMAMYSKKLAMVNLFLGAGIDQNSGSIDTTLETGGTITLTETAMPTVTLSDDMLIRGTSSCDPDKSNFRLVGGIEFGLTLFKLGVSGEYSEDNYALAGNFRFQF